MNPAEYLLGPLYDLFEGALGSTGAWIMGQLTLVGFLALAWWVISDREGIVSGLDLRPRTVGGVVALVGLTILLFFFFNDSLGYPFSGSIIVAISTSWFVQWCYVTLEGEPV